MGGWFIATVYVRISKEKKLYTSILIVFALYMFLMTSVVEIMSELVSVTFTCDCKGVEWSGVDYPGNFGLECTNLFCCLLGFRGGWVGSRKS